MSVQKRTKDLTLLERIYIPEIVKGLALTFRTMFRPKFTMEYPEEKFIPPASYRGRPVLVLDNNNIERCVACGLCSRVCPPLAIDVQAGETGTEKERCPIRFEINMLRCIFCGLCEEVCPEEAIVMSRDYEIAFSDRESAVFDKNKLLVPISALSDRVQFLRRYK